MYKIAGIIALINILVYFPKLASANDNTSTLSLPPLKTVIKYAIKNSPKIKFQKALIKKNKNRTNVERLTWIKAFSIGIDGKSASSKEQSSFGLDNGYQAGMSVKIDLFEIFSRKERVTMHENETRSSVYISQKAQKELTLEITRLYNNLKLSNKLLNIESKTFQTALINLTASEENFLNGEIEFIGLSRVRDDLSKKEISFEIRKADFKNLYSRLETILGTTLKSLR